MWKLVVILAFTYDTKLHYLMECEEVVILLVALDLLKSLLDHCDHLVYDAWVPSVFGALDLVE